MKNRILFVDDDQHVLDGLRNALRKQRNAWDMTFSLGGEQALIEMAAKPYDVIVSDMRMPGMDGATLLEIVTKEHPSVVRIILSGHAERDAILRALKVSHQFLAKPCDGEQLRTTLQRACDIKALLTNERLRAIAGRVDKLPSLPGLYWKLSEAIDAPNASAEDVGNIIRQDAAMSAKLLQIVNSAYFGLPKRIAHVGQAVAYLGLDVVRCLVLTVQAFTVADNLPPVRGFSLDRCQEHALLCASVVRKIAPTPALANDAYTAAALHEIGRVMLAVGASEQFADAIASAERDNVPVHVREREIFGVTHCEVGAYLLALWGLPLSIVEAVAYQHDSGRVRQATALDALSLLHIADALVIEAQPGTEFDSGSQIDPEWAKALGIAAELPRWATIARSELARVQAGLTSSHRILAAVPRVHRARP
jgi:HD-like signal output (HDOD) protein